MEWGSRIGSFRWEKEEIDRIVFFIGLFSLKVGLIRKRKIFRIEIIF